MAIEKKYIIAGAIGVFTITGALLYLQYRKIMDYTISIKSIKINSFSQNNVNIDIVIGFFNKSSLGFEILSQTYDVYINEKPLTTITGKQQIAVKQGDNTIPLNVAFNPQQDFTKLGGTNGLLSILSNIGAMRLKVIVNMKVKMWHMIPISIPITIDNTLKNLMAKKPQ